MSFVGLRRLLKFHTLRFGDTARSATGRALSPPDSHCRHSDRAPCESANARRPRAASLPTWSMQPTECAGPDLPRAPCHRAQGEPRVLSNVPAHECYPATDARGAAALLTCRSL